MLAVVGEEIAQSKMSSQTFLTGQVAQAGDGKFRRLDKVDADQLL